MGQAPCSWPDLSDCSARSLPAPVCFRGHRGGAPLASLARPVGLPGELAQSAGCLADPAAQGEGETRPSRLADRLEAVMPHPALLRWVINIVGDVQ